MRQPEYDQNELNLQFEKSTLLHNDTGFNHKNKYANLSYITFGFCGVVA